jgi:hypothetical protein
MNLEIHFLLAADFRTARRMFVVAHIREVPHQTVSGEVFGTTESVASAGGGSASGGSVRAACPP